MDALKLMKSIHIKYKQGFKISNVQEFVSLIDLCASEDSSIRIVACKCIEHLLVWKVIETKATLNLLIALATQTKDVDGILGVIFNSLANRCSNTEDFLLRNDLKVYVQSIRNVILTNENSILVILSILDDLDINFVVTHYKHILYDIVFVEHPHRSLAWRTLSSKIDVDLHRNFLLWLKFTRIEDCILMLESLKKLSLPKEEICLHLSAVIYNMLCSGFRPREAIDMLFANILKTDVHTQSLVCLTLFLGFNEHSNLHINVFLDLCDWCLKNCTLWTEVLWIILILLLPLAMTSVLSPKYQIQAKRLVNSLLKKTDSETKIDVKCTEINSVVLKYIIYRHDCLHQAHLILRLLAELNHDHNNLKVWLNTISQSSLEPTFRELYVIIGVYFLTKSLCVQQLCLSLFEKWKVDNAYLYIFQLARDDKPTIILELLRILSTIKVSDENHYLNELLKCLSNQNHERSFTIEMDLLIKSNFQTNKINDLLPKMINEQLFFPDSISQASLVKIIASALNIHFELTIPYCNNIINAAKTSHCTIATSMVIDAICAMCEKRNLDAAVLWNNLFTIVAGEKHPSVYKSVCTFLSRVPKIMKSSNCDYVILYKSARVLWYFVHNSSNREYAISCLREYDLDIFDATFLSDECKSHGKYSDTSIYGSKIQGSCWMHMINDNVLADLFSHYINKKYEDARFRGSYMYLFHSIIHYLRECELGDVQQILICLKLLCAKWNSVPGSEKLDCLERFSKHPLPEVRESALLTLVNFCSTNELAKYTLQYIIEENKFTEREKAMMCLLPAELLNKYREINEELLFDGLSFGLSTEFIETTTGTPLNLKIEEAIISCIKNASIRADLRRTLMKSLVIIWIKIPAEHEVCKTVSKLLCNAYGHPLLKSLPYGQFKNEMARKYIYLCRLVVAKTKSLHCFDSAITLGQKNESVQCDVLENFIEVLKTLGEERRSNNIKWVLRILCTTAINGNDFMCKILVYGIDFISGTSMLSFSTTLNDSLDRFPLALSKISRITGKGKYIILTMNELLHKTERIHPSFIEVFKFAVMRTRDEPFISYDTVLRRTFE